MGIRINKQVNIANVESRFELNFKRERTDISKLLKYLKQGYSIDSAFNGNKTIALSVRKLLVDSGLIDYKDTITPTGDEFIKYPYRSEAERGIYALSMATTEFGLEKVKFAIRMVRRLANDQREQQTFDTNEIFVGNEFSLGKNEIGVMERLINKSKSYFKEMPNEYITFDPMAGKYSNSDGEFKMGDSLSYITKKYVANLLEEKANYFRYDQTKNKLYLESLKEVSDSDLLNGTIASTIIDDIRLVNVPFEIENVELAKQYAYLFICNKLENGNYYTVDEMNEVFQNEVLSKNTISDSIKDELQNFSFSLDGFEKNLSEDKYNKLSYRLKAMKILLNIDGIKDADGFSSSTNYEDILRILKTKVSPFDVQRVYMVMGYAFAKNRKNNMILCARQFREQYENLIIVNKSGEGKVNEDQAIKNKISELGVHTINKPEIDTLFHDRYLIFELKDKTYKTFLVTCEIGSIFNLDTNETKGTLFEIPNTDVIKNGRSLIDIVKEDR